MSLNETCFHLYENIEVLDQIKEEFKKDDSKKIFILKPNYIFSLKENKTLKFIPTEALIFSDTYECGFFESIVHILLIGRIMMAKEFKINREEIKKNGEKWIKAVSDFLKVDDETILDAFLMIFNSFEVKPWYQIVDHYKCIPIPYIFGKNIEKIKNYSNLIQIILNRVINKPNVIMESNLLTIAIDEREFLINSFRKNEQSYCSFDSIKTIPNIHKFKEHKLAKNNEVYFDIIKQLCNDSNLDFDMICSQINSLQEK